MPPFQKILLKDFEELDSKLDELNVGKNILLVSGPTETKKIAEEVKKSIQSYDVKGPFVVENVTSHTVNVLRDYIGKENIGCVFGVGGGKMDAAKDAAHITGKPYIILPTSLSNDGIVSLTCVLKEYGKPYSFITTPPIAFIDHRQTILSSPFGLNASGCGDILAKFTANRDWELAVKATGGDSPPFDRVISDNYVNQAKKIFDDINKMEKITKKTKIPPGPDHEFLPILIEDEIEAIRVSGTQMNLLHSSRGASGSEHLFSHGLDLVAPNPTLHGYQVGVGSVISMYLYEKYLKEKVYGIGWKTLRQKLNYLGISTTAKKLGIRKKYMIEAFLKAPEIGKERERFTIFDYLKEFHEPRITINKKFAEEVLYKTGII